MAWQGGNGRSPCLGYKQEAELMSREFRWKRLNRKSYRFCDWAFWNLQNHIPTSITATMVIQLAPKDSAYPWLSAPFWSLYTNSANSRQISIYCLIHDSGNIPLSHGELENSLQSGFEFFPSHQSVDSI